MVRRLLSFLMSSITKSAEDEGFDNPDPEAWHQKNDDQHMVLETCMVKQMCDRGDLKVCTRQLEQVLTPCMCMTYCCWLGVTAKRTEGCQEQLLNKHTHAALAFACATYQWRS